MHFFFFPIFVQNVVLNQIDYTLNTIVAKVKYNDAKTNIINCINLDLVLKGAEVSCRYRTPGQPAPMSRNMDSKKKKKAFHHRSDLKKKSPRGGR